MVKAIPMEDWLRGCIYHDGRNGYVTLPTDKVLEIADYIQRTRRSRADGLIDLEVVEVDRKTEPSDSEKPNNCDTCANSGSYKCTNSDGEMYFKTEPLDKDTNVRSKEPQVIACPIQDDDSWIYGDFQKGIYYAWGIAQKVFDSTVTFYEAEDVAKQIDKDEPQTEKADSIPYDPWVEMGIKRMVEARLEQTDCAWKGEES